MQKIQIQTELDLKSILSQLKTAELEEFVHEISALITRRKAKDKKTKEAELLRKLNEECILSEAHMDRFRILIKKRDTDVLRGEESTELTDLIKEEEILRLKRVKVLGDLAILKGVSIQKIMSDLGIKPPQSV